MVFYAKKKEDDGSGLVGNLFSILKGYDIIGNLMRENPTGKLCDVWNKSASQLKDKMVDVALGVAAVQAEKSPEEIVNVKKSALLGSKVMKEFLVQRMENILDKDKKVKHSKLANMAEEIVRDPQKVGVKLRAEKCDLAFPPTIQSGGKYSMKLTAVSDDEILKADSMLFTLGTRLAAESILLY